ncbi:hypothetical protein LSAT2_022819, partial [Lamellibrachia satsuma]
MIQTIVRGFVASPYSNTTTRSHALHSETQVLIALRFMAKSGYLSELAKIHGVSLSTKGEHSINVMVTCDSDFIIRDMDVKWPGSCHDAFVLNLVHCMTSLKQ